MVSRQALVDSRFPTVVCAPVLTRGRGLETEVSVEPEDGLKHPSQIGCDGLVSVPKSRLTDFVGNLSPAKLSRLSQALRIALDLWGAAEECENARLGLPGFELQLMMEFPRRRAGWAAWVLLLAGTLTTPVDSQSLPFSVQSLATRGTDSSELCLASLLDAGCALSAKQAAPPLFADRWQWPASPVGDRPTADDFLASTGQVGVWGALGKADLLSQGKGGGEFHSLDPSAGSTQDEPQGGTNQVSDNKGSPRHIYWVIPAFNVTYLKNVKPLTPRQKFTQFARGAYDPVGLALGAGQAALEHSPEDGFCGYGHHWDAYAKCFGASQLDSDISGFFGDFLFPVIMHHDPRYFGLGPGSAGTVPRFLYAVSRVVVRRTDSGGTTPNYSALSGTVIAAAASNLYYPRPYRGFDHSLTRVGWDLANTVLYNVAAEFWPDIRRKVYRN